MLVIFRSVINSALSGINATSAEYTELNNTLALFPGLALGASAASIATVVG